MCLLAAMSNTSTRPRSLRSTIKTRLPSGLTAIGSVIPGSSVRPRSLPAARSYAIDLPWLPLVLVRVERVEASRQADDRKLARGGVGEEHALRFVGRAAEREHAPGGNGLGRHGRVGFHRPGRALGSGVIRRADVTSAVFSGGKIASVALPSRTIFAALASVSLESRKLRTIRCWPSPTVISTMLLPNTLRGPVSALAVLFGMV